jgi:hypothetical protein
MGVVITDEDAIAAYEALIDANGVKAHAALALGIPRKTYSGRLRTYYDRNLGGDDPVSVRPGHEIAGRTTTVGADGKVLRRSVRTKPEPEEAYLKPEGYEEGLTTFEVDGRGRMTRKWVRAWPGAVSEASIEAATERAVAKILAMPDPPRVVPRRVDAKVPGLLNFHALGDLHLGVYPAEQTAGRPSLMDAVGEYRSNMADLAARCPRAEHAIMMFGGDITEADNSTMMSRRSGVHHYMSAPYSDVLAEAEALAVYQIECGLAVYDTIEAVVLIGNHDFDTAVALGHFLRAWFRNDDRVSVGKVCEFWFSEWGRVMLGAHHCHERKIEDLPGIMAGLEGAMWGRATHKYAHGFHEHKDRAGRCKTTGARWDAHPSPAIQGIYGRTQGYVPYRALEVIHYDRDRGERGRTVQVMGEGWAPVAD